MSLRILLLAICLISLSCTKNSSDKQVASSSEIAFDETKWKIKKGWDYPYRDSMLHDLMNDEVIRGLKRDELLDILGEPTKTDENYLFYMIRQKRLNFWPLHTKTLVIEMAEDSTIHWMKIHE